MYFIKLGFTGRTFNNDVFVLQAMAKVIEKKTDVDRKHELWSDKLCWCVFISAFHHLLSPWPGFPLAV